MIPEIGQGTILKPYQKPHPPIVVTAVAPHSKGVTEAAKRGWTPISANFLLPEWVAIALAEATSREEAADAKPIRRTGAWPSPSSSPTTTRSPSATATRPKGPYHFYFKQLVRKLVGFGGRGNLFKLDQNQPDSEITPDYVTKKLVIAGTVNSVVDQILAFREKTGDFGTLLYPCHDWLDPALGEALDAADGRAGDAAGQRGAEKGASGSGRIFRGTRLGLDLGRIGRGNGHGVHLRCSTSLRCGISPRFRRAMGGVLARRGDISPASPLAPDRRRTRPGRASACSAACGLPSASASRRPSCL